MRKMVRNSGPFFTLRRAVRCPLSSAPTAWTDSASSSSLQLLQELCESLEPDAERLPLTEAQHQIGPPSRRPGCESRRRRPLGRGQGASPGVTALRWKVAQVARSPAKSRGVPLHRLRGSGTRNRPRAGDPHAGPDRAHRRGRDDPTPLPGDHPPGGGGGLLGGGGGPPRMLHPGRDAAGPAEEHPPRPSPSTSTTPGPARRPGAHPR